MGFLFECDMLHGVLDEHTFKRLICGASGSKVEAPVRRCQACLVRSTPQWRTFNHVKGAGGPVVLCNACGVRYVRSGTLSLATQHQLQARLQVVAGLSLLQGSRLLVRILCEPKK